MVGASLELDPVIISVHLALTELRLWLLLRYEQTHKARRTLEPVYYAFR